MLNVKTKPLPDTSEAEDWKDAETFIVNGKEYKLTDDLEVKPAEEEKCQRH